MQWRGRLAFVLCSLLLAPCAGGLRAQPRESPRTATTRLEAACGRNGEIAAAAGEGQDGVPFVFTVWGGSEGERIVRSTTFVSRAATLRIERVYDPRFGLEITYAAADERLTVSAKEDPSDGCVKTLWRLPGGEVLLLWFDTERSVLRGDVELLRTALSAPRALFLAMQTYARAITSLDPQPAESLRILPLRVPEADCWVGCAGGCRRQCYGFCATTLSCEVCMNACYVGCAVGCM